MRTVFIPFSVSSDYYPSESGFLNTFFSTDLHKVLIVKSINKRPPMLRMVTDREKGRPSLSTDIPISHPCPSVKSVVLFSSFAASLR